MTCPHATCPSTFADQSILVEEPKDLAGNVLPSGLLVVHDTGRGGEEHKTELTRGQEFLDPLLNVLHLDIVARADDAGLVDTGLVSVLSFIQHKQIDLPALELDDNLAVAVVIDLGEFTDVAYK